jgi:uncharacterized Zn finger protein
VNPNDTDRQVACPRCGGSHHYAARVYQVRGPLMKRCVRCGFSIKAPEYVPQERTAELRAINLAEG